MKVSYNWLKEYFQENLPSPKDLADILTLKAFEVEDVKEVGSDYMLDIDILPNRSHDCLSHYGIAKEVATITDLKLKSINLLDLKSDFNKNIEVKVENEFCRRYMALEVKNVTNGESPKELQEKLKTIGERSINTIVDITNIVMFELGQPMHAFDNDKMAGNTISVRFAKSGEKITSLDNKELELDESIPVIADDDGPIAIAGVKGGKRLEVNSETRNIILEAANFHPTVTRKTVRSVGVGTESSKRFENEPSPELTEMAMKRAVELIKKYAATGETQVSEVVDFYPRKWRNYRTGVSLFEINELLGVEFTEEQVKNALTKLNFGYEIVEPRQKVVEEAKNLLGKPYQYGASVFFDSPEKFDCSSLISYVYSLAGQSIPRTSIDQYVYSEKINESELKPGDLIFSNSKDGNIHTVTEEFLPGTEVKEGIDHVGIYLGDENVLHASRYNGDGVEIGKYREVKQFENITGYGKIITKEEKRFAITAPIERLDIKSGPDVIEEIGRVIGYDRIHDQEITTDNLGGEFNPEINKTYQLSNLIRNTLVDLGYSEVVTYSFVEKGEIEPEKPIASDKAYLRNTLLLGMEDVLERNVKNSDLLGLDRIKSFEIGKVFKKPTRQNSTSFESLNLSIGIKNKIGVKKPKPADLITDALNKLKETTGIDFKTEVKDQTEMIEINLSDLIDQFKSSDNYPELPKSENKSYKTISAYPFVLRDISVWVPEYIKAESVLEIIKDNSGELLVNNRLVDVYPKEGQVSYSYRLVFQSYEKTLSDSEVNLIMDKITEIMNGKEGWEVR